LHHPVPGLPAYSRGLRWFRVMSHTTEVRPRQPPDLLQLHALRKVCGIPLELASVMFHRSLPPRSVHPPCLPDLERAYRVELKLAVQSMLVCGLRAVAVVYLRKSLLHHVRHRHLLCFAVIALPLKRQDLRLDLGLPAKVFESPPAPKVRRDLQIYFAHARTGAAHDLKRLAGLLLRLGQAALAALGGREGVLTGDSNLVRAVGAALVAVRAVAATASNTTATHPTRSAVPRGRGVPVRPAGAR
jgi:hypothetical protein